MKLAEIHFDWNPSIPGADSRGEGLLFPLKTQSIFRADDGWTIEKLSSGEFRLHREGMPAPVVVGDGYTYVEAPEVPNTRPLIEDLQATGDDLAGLEKWLPEGTAVVTSIDGPGTNTVTLTDPEGVTLGPKPKKRSRK